MKNVKGITTMVKATAQYKALEEAMSFENQSEQERKKAAVKTFENTCLTAQAIKKIDDFYGSAKFKAELKKLEVTKITKKEFVDKVLGMSFGGYTEYIKIANSSKTDQKRFLKGCEQLEAQGGSVSRSKKNYIKFLKEVGDAKAKGGEAKVQAKETSKGMFQLKLTIDNVAHDVRVDLTSNGAIKTKNEAQAIIKAIDIFKAQVLQGLQSASDKAPKKAPKKVAVK